jgi:uncharacterized protein
MGKAMELREQIFFHCGSIVLEGIIERPDGPGHPSAAAVICHPHPLFGGNMHNHVVRSVKKGLLARNFACLRFNFRGAGHSEGTHADGIGEVEDVRAALDFLQEQTDIKENGLVVAGYSFGCWVGLRAAAADPRPSLLIGVSPPLNEYDFRFLENETRPKLLVVGDRDQFCSVNRFRNLVDQIPEPREGVVFPGADHFTVGGEQLLIAALDAFLDHTMAELSRRGV